MPDLSFLSSFTKGDRRKMSRYISMYLSEAEKAFTLLQNHLEKQEWEQVKILAHSLKPQAEMMGLHDLQTVLIAIEDEVEAGQVSTISSLIHQAVTLHHTAAEQLKAEIV